MSTSVRGTDRKVGCVSRVSSRVGYTGSADGWLRVVSESRTPKQCVAKDVNKIQLAGAGIVPAKLDHSARGVLVQPNGTTESQKQQ